MNRFRQALLEAETRLTVPEPARSRILLELSADMEDLFQEYLARGMDETEAETATFEHFDLSEDVLTELVRVHDTPLERSLEGLSVQVQNPWSRFLLAGLGLFFLVGSGAFLIRPEVYRVASPLVWLLLPLLGMGLWAAGVHLYRAHQGGDGWSPGSQVGLGRLMVLAPVIILVAAGGLWVEFYLCALSIRETPGQALVYLVGWLHMASATLVIFLSGALVLAFLWFFLDFRARKQERSAAATLLGGVA